MGDTGLNRIVEDFIMLSRFDSESFHERKIAKYVIGRLVSVGVEIRTDTTNEKYLKTYPNSFPNIYGFLPGNKEGEPILFSAHLDTVSPGNGKKAYITEEGKITSDGDTVLGADDISGIVSILEGLERLKEGNFKHPDIEILFTVAEEPFCEGSRYFDYSILKSRSAYVFDLNGPVGRAAIAAPTIISFEIGIEEKGAHAGFAPEEGINALNIAVETLSDFKTGYIDGETTVNFGTIAGGTGKNIVPENVKITGEVRSLNHQKASDEVERILKRFEQNARKAGGFAYCSRNDHIRAFKTDENDLVTDRFLRAAKSIGISRPELIATMGGSDGSRFQENGIKTLVLACAMENVHTTREYTDVKELERAAELALALMTV